MNAPKAPAQMDPNADNNRFRKLTVIACAASAVTIVGFALLSKHCSPLSEPIHRNGQPSSSSSSICPAAAAAPYMENDGKCDWQKGERGKDCDKYSIGNRVYDLGIEDDKRSERYSDVDKICMEMLQNGSKIQQYPRIANVHVGIKDGADGYRMALVPAKVVWKRTLPGDDELKNNKDELGRDGVRVTYNPDGNDMCLNTMRYTIELACGDYALQPRPVDAGEEDPPLPKCGMDSKDDRTSFQAEANRSYASVVLGSLAKHDSELVELVGDIQRVPVSISGKLMRDGSVLPLTVISHCSNASRRDGSCRSADLLPILRNDISIKIGAPETECLLSVSVTYNRTEKVKPQEKSP